MNKMKMEYCDNKIVIVLVLYKKQLEESISYQSLIGNIKQLKHQFHLIIYNNSSEIEIPLSEFYTVIANENNNKLAGAYNYAFTFAKEKNAKWLLLLDHDTTITSEYLQILSSTLDDKVISDNSNIVAITPFLTNNNKIISPHKLCFFKNIARKVQYPGIQRRHIIALNTLSLLRIDFLNQIDGFSTNYPLDMLDYWIYSQVYKHKKEVLVMNCGIEHDLSVLDYDKNLSTIRYKGILEAEKRWFSEFNLISQLLYKLRLFLRFCKQFVFVKNKEFSLITLKNIFK